MQAPTMNCVPDSTGSISTPRHRPGPTRAALLVAVTLALGAGLCRSGDAAAAPRLQLTPQPNVPFPVRVYVVSTPGAGVPRDVRVTENGNTVSAGLAAVGEKRVPFSAALLLDSSLTMIGKPLVAARTAATTLVARKPARSELALYGFTARPYLLHDWSSSKRSLVRSLGKLRTRYGTAVWDSVVLASNRLRERKGSAKAIVVLTDGRFDTTHTRPASALAAATRAGARVFVVIGGRSDPAQVARLQRLADATGGTLLRVTSIGELRNAFAGIARTLSRQYLLSYASKVQTPGAPVDVRVEIDGARATTSYTVPKTAEQSSGKSIFFSTGGGFLLVILLVAILVGVPILVMTTISRRRRRDMWNPYKKR